MISRSQIEELRDSWQTTELNVAREYVQHVLLSSLYRGLRKQVKLAFKGGTALRILRGSPRFSEDLDFTGWGKRFHIGESLKETVREAGKAGLDFELEESGPTSGGWFAAAATKVHGWPIRIAWNISLRGTRGDKTDATLVTTPLWVAYSVQSLPVDRMVYEKVDALFRRRKPRDFFDLYFLLRKRLGIPEIVKHKGRLVKETEQLDARSLQRELKQILPKSHWMIPKQLPRLLAQELARL